MLPLLLAVVLLVTAARADVFLPFAGSAGPAPLVLPSDFTTPGVVCFPQLMDVEQFGDALYVSCNSNSISDPAVVGNGAVVLRYTRDGGTIIWNAGRDSGVVRLTLEGGQLVGYYIDGQTRHGRRVVLAPQVQATP